MTCYYNEFHPPAAAMLRGLIADGLIPPGGNAIVHQVASTFIKAAEEAIGSA